MKATNKKKILFIIVGILLTLGIVVEISYAWWTHTVNQEGINTIQSTCLEIELADENPITLQNVYPITDYEASFLTPYTFTIKNKCNTMLEYDVNLDIMENKDSEGKDNRLSSSYVAIEFNGEKKKLLNTLESVETSYPKTDYTPVEGRYLVSGTLDSNESKSYSLKLWMDEHVTIEDDAMNKNFISKVVVTAKQSHEGRLVDYVISDNETEEFKHEATAQTPALTDYRYTGANPNNYVYFGCEGNETNPCTDDNLYRIIGVTPTQKTNDGEYENRVKLIKANDWLGSSAGNSNVTITGKGYKWNTNNANKWEDSSLNNTLNNEYYNSLREYQKYIEPIKWHLGALTNDNYHNYKVEEYYAAERGKTKGYSGGALSFIANIGLMYPSDFAYSLDKEGNNSIVISKSQYDNQELYKANAWLYQSNAGDYKEWTITPESSYYDTWGSSAAVTHFGGYIYTTARVNYSENFLAVRPTFYLKSNVLYESGNGTQENPFRISINE